VIAQLRAELFKQRSTRTAAGLAAAMAALVLAAVLMHALLLPVENLRSETDQLQIALGWGERLGALFAALLGAIAFTAEYRYGTIRPTLLVTPRRSRVVVAKLTASVLGGAVLGVLGAAIAASAGSIALSARGLDVALDSSDYLVLMLGSAGAGALWAAIGAGLGALVRQQVPVLVGLSAWLLFVESVLIGDANLVGAIGRYTPGSLGNAASGQEPLLAPTAAIALLALYAAGAAWSGWRATERRDVA
jgi:ABC-2 type transport system permease protein